MTWIRVMSLADFPAHGVARAELGGQQIALFRIDGEVFAVADRCSHAEASLAEGEVFDHEVECPRHGATFDVRTGEALTLPASQPVHSYPVRVDGDDVAVEVAS